MKKLKLTTKALFMLLAVVVSSCSSDDGNSGGGTSAGDYYPLAVNNSWTFENLDTGETVESRFVATEQQGGKSYFQLNSSEFLAQASVWISKDGGNYNQRVDDLVIEQFGFTTTTEGYEITIFKDNAPVGQTWTDSATFNIILAAQGQSQTSTATVAVTGENLFKGSATVNGVTYPDVIKARYTLESTVLGQPGSNAVVTEMWFAKDVGPIKSTTTGGNGVSQTLELQTYTLN
ncbi:hypothetical protein [Flavobacterium sp.]|uniref:hypothetical protein n=1 Tax=Flavobacterium sp. TaxID=239 RepID=UPI0026053940|nr:hypothetical protein [Flavobacterium sp.]